MMTGVWVTACTFLLVLNSSYAVKCYVGLTVNSRSLQECGATSDKCGKVVIGDMDSWYCYSEMKSFFESLPSSGCQLIATPGLNTEVCVCTGDGCNVDESPSSTTHTIALTTKTTTTSTISTESVLANEPTPPPSTRKPFTTEQSTTVTISATSYSHTQSSPLLSAISTTSSHTKPAHVTTPSGFKAASISTVLILVIAIMTGYLLP